MRNSLLYRKVSKKGFRPSHVAEVGVWHPETSNIYNFIQSGVKATLVEPDPTSIDLIKEKFTQGNVTLHEVALCDFDGEVEFCKREASTFVSSLSATPAIINDGCNISETEKFIAKAIKFDAIDDGSIDLLSVDTEGSEWFAIKNMLSRPTILSIETHGGIYKNPYINELNDWLREHDYNLWYMSKSDSVYVLNERIAITGMDKLELFLFKIRLKIRFNKKLLSRKIKKLIR